MRFTHKKLKTFNKLAANLAIFSLIFCANNSTANTDNDTPIFGAGAHFAWIVFDKMKKELEEIADRPLDLYGEGSLLGVGCNAGIKTALKSKPGKETFGFTCCPISDKEIQEKKIVVYPIAKEPILIVVHESNPLNSVSTEKIRAVFRGEITNWKQLGGADKPIVVVSRLHCKKRPGHWKTILPEAKLFRQDRLNVTSAEEMLNNINSLKYAIGHIGSAWVFKSTDKVKILKVDGIEPTAKNLVAGTYPFYRRLSAISNLEPSKIIIDIINHARTSPTMLEIAKQFELVPIK